MTQLGVLHNFEATTPQCHPVLLEILKVWCLSINELPYDVPIYECKNNMRVKSHSVKAFKDNNNWV